MTATGGGLIGVLEVGGSHVTAAAVRTADLDVVARHRAPLDSAAAPGGLLAALAAAAGRVPPVRAWSVAFPGPFDYAAGIVRVRGLGKFDALYGLDLGAALAPELGGHRPVFCNDADAFLLGESCVGAVRHTARCAALTLGTGVGSAFLADGRIVDEGPDVPPLGEVHLLEIEGRPLEDVVSGRAIRRAHADRGGDPAADLREIVRLARGGDPRAAAVLDEAFTALGTAVAPWLDRFGATDLVLGGAVSRAWDVLGPAFDRGVGSATEVPTATTTTTTTGGNAGPPLRGRLRTVVSADHETSALVGAATVALAEEGTAA